jgi:hypothetical protein
MLRSLNDLEGYAIGATDGIVGQVKDLYFDDQAWVIRYLVVDTGPWLLSRKVLISPIAIGSPNWIENRNRASTNIMGVPAIGRTGSSATPQFHAIRSASEAAIEKGACDWISLTADKRDGI